MVKTESDVVVDVDEAIVMDQEVIARADIVVVMLVRVARRVVHQVTLLLLSEVALVVVLAVVELLLLSKWRISEIVVRERLLARFYMPDRVNQSVKSTTWHHINS